MGSSRTKKKPTAKAGKPRARKPATDAASAATAAPATDDTTGAAGAKTGERGAKAGKPAGKGDGGKVSCLDAAAKVLATAQEPLPCRQIIELMRHDGLWHSDAATPHATLYAALLREITKKGEASRFVKVDRGRFALRGAS